MQNLLRSILEAGAPRHHDVVLDVGVMTDLFVNAHIHNHYNMCILTKDYNKNITTIKLLTISHMTMFVENSVHIQNNGPVINQFTVMSSFTKHTHTVQV